MNFRLRRSIFSIRYSILFFSLVCYQVPKQLDMPAILKWYFPFGLQLGKVLHQVVVNDGIGIDAALF